MKIFKVCLVLVLSTSALLITCKAFSSDKTSSTKVTDSDHTNHSVMVKDGKRSSGYYSRSTGKITYRDSSGKVVQQCIVKGNTRVCK